ncbi:MAG: hypothetical protein LBI74_09090 [Synergistaceae bacterium]|jgi:hypothetical protein|nr:hypothetical protein [Synergistaceae bacterium]
MSVSDGKILEVAGISRYYNDIQAYIIQVGRITRTDSVEALLDSDEMSPFAAIHI